MTIGNVGSYSIKRWIGIGTFRHQMQILAQLPGNICFPFPLVGKIWHSDTSYNLWIYSHAPSIFHAGWPPVTTQSQGHTNPSITIKWWFKGKQTYSASGPRHLAIVDGAMNFELCRHILQGNVKVSIHEWSLTESWLSSKSNSHLLNKRMDQIKCFEMAESKTQT